MPLDWEQEQRAPSRAELAREEHEDMMRDTYETRFVAYCHRNWLDPEDVGSVLIYETEWEEDEVERGRYDPADPGG